MIARLITKVLAIAIIVLIFTQIESCFAKIVNGAELTTENEILNPRERKLFNENLEVVAADDDLVVIRPKPTTDIAVVGPDGKRTFLEGIAIDYRYKQIAFVPDFQDTKSAIVTKLDDGKYTLIFYRQNEEWELIQLN